MTEINPQNTVLAELQFGVGGIQAQMEAVEAMVNRTALTAQEAFAKTQIGTSVNTGQLTAQQAMAQSILKESEVRKAAIVAEGEAKISQIQAKEALARQQIAQREAQTILTTTQQQVARQQLMYMQARQAAFESQPTGMLGLVGRHISWMATGFAIFGTLSLLKEGLVDVEKGMKGLSTVLPEVHESQEAYNQAEEDAINLMQTYGASIDEVMASARSFGRMYKDEAVVMGLVNNSILMNVVDNVALEEAVRGNEAALAVYGDTLTSVNEIMAFSNHTMDAWTRLSHESMASATDLINITERASGAAKVAKTNFDQLMGLGASAVRATGLPGANIGRRKIAA